MKKKEENLTFSNNIQFHPFEVAFVGFSGSGKTTLISKLLDRFSKEHQMSYLKHDAHHFDIDHVGKDTHTMWNGGAFEVLISDQQHFAHVQRKNLGAFDARSSLISADILLIEGYKDLEIPKIIVCDEQDKILDVFKDKKENILGVVTSNTVRLRALSTVRCAHRDDINLIWSWIKNEFENKIRSTPLQGLVLCGGKSTRMHRDKALLGYHGKTQARFVYELLEQRCNNVFLSSRPGQLAGSDSERLPQIHDEFLDMGPLGGILTAMKKYPASSWVVAACDLPYLTQELLDTLLLKRNPYKFATCFKGWKEKPEPLFAVYEPKSYFRLLQGLGLGYQCPRSILMNSSIEELSLPNSNSLTNVNTLAEFEEAKKHFLVRQL